MGPSEVSMRLHYFVCSDTITVRALGKGSAHIILSRLLAGSQNQIPQNEVGNYASLSLSIYIYIYTDK